YNLRIVKSKEAASVRVVRTGEEGAEDAVSILKVSELEHYKFYLKELATKAGLTQYEAQALVHLLGIRNDAGSYREIWMGKQLHKRYSGRALHLLREAKTAGRVEEAKATLRQHYREQRQAKSKQ